MMPQVSEVPVHLDIRTMKTGIVAVPEACIEQCRNLTNELGQAALHELEDVYDAIVCDDESRRYSFPRKCAAIRAVMRFQDAHISPMIVGESESRSWADRVTDAINEHGAYTVLGAAQKRR